jgi:hypothetical protein
MDAAVFSLAKKKGYDSICYTEPAYPAIRELVVFRFDSLANIEEV